MNLSHFAALRQRGPGNPLDLFVVIGVDGRPLIDSLSLQQQRRLAGGLQHPYLLVGNHAARHPLVSGCLPRRAATIADPGLL